MHFFKKIILTVTLSSLMQLSYSQVSYDFIISSLKMDKLQFAEVLIENGFQSVGNLDFHFAKQNSKNETLYSIWYSEPSSYKNYKKIDFEFWTSTEKYMQILAEIKKKCRKTGFKYSKQLKTYVTIYQTTTGYCLYCFKNLDVYTIEIAELEDFDHLFNSPG